MYDIKNGYVIGANTVYKFKDTGLGATDFIVLHNTAGSSVSGSASHLKKYGFGYHFIIDRNGDLYQGMQIGRKVSHAGASNWRGINYLNKYIGVCFANWGGSKTSQPTHKHNAEHYNGGNTEKYWEDYANQQVDVGLELCESIIKKYPNVREIIRHDDIAIGRKMDTGPALSMAAFEDLRPQWKNTIGKPHRVHVNPGDTLSIRKWRAASSKKIGELQKDELVFIRSIAYDYKNEKPVKSSWASIATDGRSHVGYVSTKYLRPT